MATNREIERLQIVYHGYRQSQAVQARWSEANPGNQAILQERTEALKQLLQGYHLPLSQCRVLDVGCGSGRVLARLAQWGANPEFLCGVDLLSDRVHLAAQHSSQIHFQQGNAEQLPFGDASFDLVLLFTVLSSILSEQMACHVAGQVERVLKPGGAVTWYDFRYNNPRNPRVQGMNKKRVQILFPQFELRLRTITLMPPLARRLGRLTLIIYPMLSKFVFLQSHYLG